MNKLTAYCSIMNIEYANSNRVRLQMTMLIN